MRDEQLPLPRRHTALWCAVGAYCPLGFNATWAYLASTAHPDPDLRRDPAALLRALETLEESRAVRLADVQGFADRRHMEKAAGRRSPRASETGRLRGPCWPTVTAPSRLGLVSAVADRLSAFRRWPYPDGTLPPGAHVRLLADLHADLDTCASSYLSALGRIDGQTAEELARTVNRLHGLVRPGYTPLNTYLLPWLRFARLLAYAADVSRGG